MKSFIVVNQAGRTQIDERKFANYIQEKYQIRYLDNQFYDKNGEILDEGWIRSYISKELYDCGYISLAVMVARCLATLKDTVKENLAVAVGDKSHYDIDFLNGRYTVKDGELISKVEENDYFSINKFNFRYVPLYDKIPAKWLAFLHDLLEEEDIFTLQEYLGSCLISSKNIQKALVITGKGGEGKSIVGKVMSAIFGKLVAKSSIYRIERDKYFCSSLANKLLHIDDDLSCNTLKETGVFKQLISDNDPILVEQKYQASYETVVPTKFLMFGNDVIDNLSDRSHGWFRRFIILKTKDKPVDRNDNKMLIDELYGELESIFYWCLQGLLRLSANNWNFSFKESIDDSISSYKKETVNVEEFIEDNAVFGENETVSSKEAYDTYMDWCRYNASEPLSTKDFRKYLLQQTMIKPTRNVYIHGQRCRGYLGLRVEKMKTYSERCVA